MVHNMHQVPRYKMELPLAWICCLYEVYSLHVGTGFSGITSFARLVSDVTGNDSGTYLDLSPVQAQVSRLRRGLMRSLSLSARACVLVFVGTRPLLWSQGVVAFLQGDSGKASGLLIRASAEAKSLKPNPALAARLMQQWHAVKFEVLRPKVRSIVQLEQLSFYVLIEETGGAGMLMWLAKSGS